MRASTLHARRSLYLEALQVLRAEHGRDLELDEVAQRLLTSRRQLQRVFAEVGDTTFRELLTRVRMQRAAELLSDPGPMVREVAHAVGYRQPAQFAKAFRRHTGVAPAEFRARVREARRQAA